MHGCMEVLGRVIFKQITLKEEISSGHETKHCQMCKYATGIRLCVAVPDVSGQPCLGFG